MTVYDQIDESIRTARVLFLALNGLKDAGDLTEDEIIGLFSMAGDIANQLTEVRGEMEGEVKVKPLKGVEPSEGEEAVLTLKDRGFQISYSAGVNPTIEDLVEKVIYLLQGATYSQKQIFAAFDACRLEMSGEIINETAE